MGSIRTLPLAITIEFISIFSFSFLNKKITAIALNDTTVLQPPKREGNVT
jgi:hypothetical protein